MSDGSEKNSKGTVLEIQGSYYKVKLEDGTDVHNAKNASSVDVIVGDKVVIGYVDSLHNPIISSVYNKAGISKDDLKEALTSIKEDIQQELLERDHPVGSPYFTFIVSDNPNNRFPGTEWVRVEENTYLVSAGDGINALDKLGSNSQSVRIDDQHSHEQYLGLPTSFAEIDGNTGTGAATVVNPAHKSTTTARADRASLTGFLRNTKNSGTQPNNQTFDNRPKSIAIYMWRRIA